MTYAHKEWNEGWRARQVGKDATDNPYPADSEPWGDWLAGWTDLDEHLCDRDEALASIGWFG